MDVKRQIEHAKAMQEDNNGGVTLTIAQAKALFKRWESDELDETLFEDFLDTVKPTFGMDGAVVVEWCRMWLVIEKDGYTHS